MPRLAAGRRSRGGGICRARESREDQTRQRSEGRTLAEYCAEGGGSPVRAVCERHRCDDLTDCLSPRRLLQGPRALHANGWPGADRGGAAAIATSTRLQQTSSASMSSNSAAVSTSDEREPAPLTENALLKPSIAGHVKPAFRRHKALEPSARQVIKTEFSDPSQDSDRLVSEPLGP